MDARKVAGQVERARALAVRTEANIGAAMEAIISAEAAIGRAQQSRMGRRRGRDDRPAREESRAPR
jgi:hypothetical protein